MNALWQFVDGMQDAVDPEPHYRDISLGLKVNVACPLIKGVVKEMVNGIDDVPIV